MGVKQISNLFVLMELFAQEQKPLSVADIVAALGWPRSSVFNIVSTLVDEGYLFQPVARGGYRPTTRWADLASRLVESELLPEAVHRALVRLMEQTGETVFLAAAEGSSVVFLDVVEPPASIRFAADVGQRLPIHVTAAGKAILAQYTLAERVAQLRRFNIDSPQGDRQDSAERLAKEIERDAARGWFTNMGQYAPGLAGIAVPFPYRNRRMAIALGGPVSRVEEHANDYGRLLGDAVTELLSQTPSSATA